MDEVQQRRGFVLYVLGIGILTFVLAPLTVEDPRPLEWIILAPFLGLFYFFLLRKDAPQALRDVLCKRTRLSFRCNPRLNTCLGIQLSGSGPARVFVVVPLQRARSPLRAGITLEQQGSRETKYCGYEELPGYKPWRVLIFLKPKNMFHEQEVSFSVVRSGPWQASLLVSFDHISEHQPPIKLNVNAYGQHTRVDLRATQAPA